jgi:Tol biopolymer transport system component
MKRPSRIFYLILNLVFYTFFTKNSYSAGKPCLWSEVLLHNEDYVLLRKVSITTSTPSCLELINQKTNESVKLVDWPNEVVVSPDSTKIAYTQCKDPGVWVYDLVENKLVKICDKCSYSLSFSTDSTKISFLTIEDEDIVLRVVTIDGKKNKVVYKMKCKEWR